MTSRDVEASREGCVRGGLKLKRFGTFGDVEKVCCYKGRGRASGHRHNQTGHLLSPPITQPKL